MNLFELFAFFGSGAAVLLVFWVLSKLFTSTTTATSESVDDDEAGDGYLGSSYLNDGYLDTGHLSTGAGCAGYEDDD
jgi:hypothetical protein